MKTLFIDIGNTRIKYTDAHTPNAALAISHEKRDTLIPTMQTYKRVIVTAGRSPHAQASYTNIIEHATRLGISTHTVTVIPEILTINYADPTQFGADRFLNILAAQQRVGKNFCVLSAGTAITLDFFTTQHIGGMILPGIGSLVDVLQEKTGLTDIKAPSGLLGNDTKTSISAGIYVGMQNLVTESIHRVATAEGVDFTCIATGGDAEQAMPSATIVPALLFEGMKHYSNLIPNTTPMH